MKRKLIILCLSALLLLCLIFAAGCANGGEGGGLFGACSEGGTSGSDTPVDGDPEASVGWEVQSDDESYLALTKTKTEWIMDKLTELSAQKESFAEYETSQRVEASREYAEMKEEVLEWCESASSYPSSSLQGDTAKETHRLLLELSDRISAYVTEYPKIVTGESDGAQFENDIVETVVELYIVLWE